MMSSMFGGRHVCVERAESGIARKGSTGTIIEDGVGRWPSVSVATWWRPSAALFRVRLRSPLWLTFFVGVLDDVLDDDGDAPVGRVERGVWLPEALVGEAANLRDLIGTNSVGLDDAAGRVGAVGGKFPIAVGGRWGIRLRIGVALNGQLVGKAAELLSEGNKELTSVSIELGAGFATATLLPRTANVLPLMDLN